MNRNGVPVRNYREVFFAHNGPGPYPCYFCGEEVDFDRVIVHHDDHDRKNNAKENLKPAHVRCYTAHHVPDYPCPVLTDAGRERIREMRRNSVASPETRAKISAAVRGRTVSDETRAKMSASRRAYWARRREEAARVK